MQTVSPVVGKTVVVSAIVVVGAAVVGAATKIRSTPSNVSFVKEKEKQKLECRSSVCGTVNSTRT
jgi:hypothetical protein